MLYLAGNDNNMKNKTKTSSKTLITTILSTLIISLGIVSIIPQSNAETPESLLAQYEIIANENIKLQGDDL